MKSSSIKILILDEHAPSLTVLCHVLAARGYTCEGVTSAADALSCIAWFQPHAVVYDWILRGDAGVGLASKLRGASTGVVAVIVLSTQNEPDGFREREDIDAYFTKPYDFAKLEAEVLRLTVLSHAAHESRRS